MVVSVLHVCPHSDLIWHTLTQKNQDVFVPAGKHKTNHIQRSNPLGSKSCKVTLCYIGFLLDKIRTWFSGHSLRPQPCWHMCCIVLVNKCKNINPIWPLQLIDISQPKGERRFLTMCSWRRRRGRKREEEEPAGMADWGDTGRNHPSLVFTDSSFQDYWELLSYLEETWTGLQSINQSIWKNLTQHKKIGSQTLIFLPLGDRANHFTAMQLREELSNRKLAEHKESQSITNKDAAKY